jgi:hypothetical protein
MHAGAVSGITGRILAFCRGASACLLASGLLSGCGAGDSSPTSIDAPENGSLVVTIAGLPSGLAAAVTVNGPNGYTTSIQASATVTRLVPGTYTVSGSEVSGGQSTYTASPVSQSAVVPGGGTGTAEVQYGKVPSPPSSGLNLTIAGVYLTQAVQRFDGSVPLLAGRDAYLRVFATANLANAAEPRVRVRLYQGTALVQSGMVAGPLTGVPPVPNEGVLTSSWNVLVPGALIQPGLRLLVEVDPDGLVAETSEADNQYPASGVPDPVDVRVLPTFNVLFVPVLQQVSGQQGNVTDANKEQFLAEVKQVLPVGAYDAAVRAAYTTNAQAVQSGNANGAWGTILSEVQALRVAEGSSRYYYGVVKTGYASGIAGMGYVGGTARTAVGWDRLPSAAGIMAHEVGHNMGRMHAPCGSAGTTDPAFPHPGGTIGVWGLNVATLALKPPTTADLMGYCSPDWVSDYSWSGMVGYRENGANNAPPAGSGTEGLLIWGRLTPDGIVLEPAFRVPVRAEHLSGAGPHRVELLDDGGQVLSAARFAGHPVGDLPGAPEEHFAFVVPVASVVESRITGVRVIANARTAMRRTVSGSTDPDVVVTRRSESGIEVRWDGTRYPMALIRDARTGEVLSFARGGSALIAARSQTLDLQLSDGVRGMTRRRQVPRF